MGRWTAGMARMNCGWLAALVCATLLLGGCGGSEPAETAGPSPWPAPSRAQAAAHALARPALRAPLVPPGDLQQPTPDQLLDWAQEAYPQFFSGSQPNQYHAPYTYRYYPQTGNYVGVADGSVYVMGPVAGGTLGRVGALSDFTCAVFFDQCSAVASIDVQGTLVSYTAPASEEVANGGYLRNQGMHMRFTGDPLALQGRTVYVYIVDPWGLYELFYTSGPVDARDGSATFDVYLTGKRQTTGGVKSGSLKVYACLDPQCAQRLAGSPFVMPYNVNVGDGVRLASDHVDVNVTAPDTGTTTTMQVTLPRYTTSWAAALDPYTYLYTVSSTAASGRLDSGTVTLTMPAQTPGSYTQNVRVTAYVTMPGGTSYSTSSTFETRKVVTGTVQAPYVFSPSEVNVTLAYGTKGWQPLDFALILRDGVHALRYLSWQNGGNMWLRDENGQNLGPLGVTACPLYQDCLPPGVYRGAISYDIYDSVYGTSFGRPGVPVTLTITH